jgi:hypothetical protein
MSQPYQRPSTIEKIMINCFYGDPFMRMENLTKFTLNQLNSNVVTTEGRRILNLITNNC